MRTGIEARPFEQTSWRTELPGDFTVTATASPTSPVLDAFFTGYDRAFVLADEREELEGFRRCLALNPVSRHRFGRTQCEVVLVLRQGDRLVGGANFLATALAPPSGHPPVAVALNYLFVEEAFRGRGMARRLLAAVQTLANRAVDGAENEAVAIFIEQNDPLLLSEADYAIDNSHAGIDQVDRLAVWARMGARIVDVAYVQPALSADQQADARLTYAAVGFPLAAIDARYLRDHFESFFGISVLKGGDPAGDAVAGPQLRALERLAARGETVALLGLEDVLPRLRQGLGLRGMPLRRFARMAG